MDQFDQAKAMGKLLVVEKDILALETVGEAT